MRYFAINISNQSLCSVPHKSRLLVSCSDGAVNGNFSLQVDSSTLDFTAQRSRIAVKNPRVRPPTDPRSLLQMPSVEPTPPAHLPVKAPAGVPLGGLGIGIKLPGRSTRRKEKLLICFCFFNPVAARNL